ncbi:hypothetical protein [uncultured Microbulbifer sp.]|uniref:hypothetical protein n=1 Tax=uncultured Microbulbifer sp. TaxID=348147 RepID=UPI00262180C7|nr:hypothetical protein [uncultured Microbulbifer sp.]
MSDIIRRPRINGTHKVSYTNSDVASSLKPDRKSVRDINDENNESEKEIKLLKQEVASLKETISKRNAEIKNIQKNLRESKDSYETLKSSFENKIDLEIKKGYSEGWQQAKKEYKQHLVEHQSKLSSEFSEKINLLNKLSESQWANVTEKAVSFALEISGKVFGYEYIKENGLKALVINLINEAPEKKCITIKASPFDIDRLKKIHGEIEGAIGGKVNLSPIKNFKNGEIFAECDVCILDGSLDKQLMVIKDTVLLEFEGE